MQILGWENSVRILKGLIILEANAENGSKELSEGKPVESFGFKQVVLMKVHNELFHLGFEFVREQIKILTLCIFCKGVKVYILVDIRCVS